MPLAWQRFAILWQYPSSRSGVLRRRAAAAIQNSLSLVERLVFRSRAHGVCQFVSLPRFGSLPMSDVHSSDPVYTTSHQVAVDEEVYPRISWRAVIAGVVVLMALSWLMHLLGAATGMSVADATDSATMEGGLPVASSIWMIVSWLIAFFVGGLVAARLAGNISD